MEEHADPRFVQFGSFLSRILLTIFDNSLETVLVGSNIRIILQKKGENESFSVYQTIIDLYRTLIKMYKKWLLNKYVKGNLLTLVGHLKIYSSFG